MISRALATTAALVAGALLTPAISSGAVQSCGTTQLAASLQPGSPGAGQRYALLVLRNRSSQGCAISGYAGLLLLDSRRRALPTNVLRDRSRTPRSSVLAPGHQTRALLHWSVIPGSGEPQTGACERNPSWIEVTPPNQRRQLVIRWPFGPVCEHGQITATPFGQTVL